MTTLPQRTLLSTAVEHLADHNALHLFNNLWDGVSPSTLATTYAAISHTHPTTAITSGVFATNRLGTGTPTASTYLRGDGAWALSSAFALAAHNHAASDTTSGIFSPARLGTGPTGSNYLRGDGVFAAAVPAPHVHNTADVTAGVFATGRLGTGTASSSNYLRGDGTWQPVVALAVTSPIGVPLSSFSGANDDQRLANYDAARRTAGSGLHGYPVVLDENRTYTFVAPLAIDDGFCIVGTVRPQEQSRGSEPLASKVALNLTSPGGWFTVPSRLVFGIALRGLSIVANSNSRVFQPNAGATLWTTTLRDVSYINGPGLIGSTATKQGVDALTVEGYCNWNNLRDCALNIGGSDNSINCTKLLIDSQHNPVNFLGDAGYLLKFGGLSKTDITGIYMTAEAHSGILLTGGNNMLTFKRCFIEGRNDGHVEADDPCMGALVRDSTGWSQYESCWFGYAMINPAGSGHGDLGYIHCTDGVHEFINCHTRLALVNNPATTSTIFATGTGTHIIVRNFVGEGNGAGTPGGAGQSDGTVFKPRVRVVGGATYDCDDSVVVVTS